MRLIEFKYVIIELYILLFFKKGDIDKRSCRIYVIRVSGLFCIYGVLLIYRENIEINLYILL